MNVHQFLALTKASGRRFLNRSHSEKDVKILHVGLESLAPFLFVYQRKFHKQLSQEQQNIIETIVQLCRQPLTQSNFSRLLAELQKYHSFGMNILVRHPESLLSSYRKEPGRNLSMRGMIQAWRFNRFLRKFLEIYDGVNLRLYISDSKRTGIFADLTYSYLSRNSHARLLAPRQNIFLSGTGERIKDIKNRYPTLKQVLDDGKPINRRKIILLREYFKQWIAESPLSRATSNEIRSLMGAFTENTINIYFSHESVIGSYLHHALGQGIDNVLITFAGYVITVKNHAHISY